MMIDYELFARLCKILKGVKNGMIADNSERFSVY